MKIDRKLFEAALQIAKKGISKKADITSKTLVEIKNSGISLVGMNDGMSVITNMPPNSFVFEETEEKKFLVDPSFMMDLLKQLPKSVTEVEFDAENGLVLRYEKSEFKLETIEGADMFPMPTKKGVDENFVTIEANDLRRMVRATAFVSVRKDDSVSVGQEAMKCLAIHCAKDDIKIYAANPYLFSSCLKTHENNGADFNVLIYAEDINEAINAFQNKEIQIFADDKFMYLADDYTFISLRIVNAKELTINTTLKTIETNKDLTKVNVAKNLILGTIKRACLLSTDRKMIRILLKANKETNLLNIQGKSDRGSINEDIEAIIDGKDAEICFNGSYLLEVLNALDCENTEIRFDAADERIPMLVKNGDDEVVTDSTYAIALLKNKKEQRTDIEDDELNFLSKRGSKMLLISAVSTCMESLLGKKILDSWRLVFKDNKNFDKLVEEWKAILDVLMPWHSTLEPAIVSGLKSKEATQNAAKQLRATLTSFSSMYAQQLKPFSDSINTDM